MLPQAAEDRGGGAHIDIFLFRDCETEQWILKSYSRFQVTFQSAFPKFVLNIPNYITKFGIVRENVQSEICTLVN